MALNSCQAQLFPAANAGKDIYAFSQIIVDSWRRCRTSFQVRAGPVISIQKQVLLLFVCGVCGISAVLCWLLSHLQLAKTYGNVFTLWFGWAPVIILNGFQAVKDGMTTHPEDVSGRLVSPFFRAMAKGKGAVVLFFFFAQKHYIYNCNSFVAGAHPNNITMAGFVYEG